MLKICLNIFGFCCYIVYWLKVFLNVVFLLTFLFFEEEFIFMKHNGIKSITREFFFYFFHNILMNLSYIDEIYCVSKCRARKIRIPIQKLFQPISLKSHYITQTFGIDVGQLRLIFWLTFFILLQKKSSTKQTLTFISYLTISN